MEKRRFSAEHRFMFHAKPKCKLSDLGIERWYLGPLGLEVDNRVDWRIRHNKAHVYTWRYVPEPKIYYPVFKTEKLTISPYVKNRFYFDLTDGIGYNGQRIYTGLSFKLFKHLDLDWFYMRLAERSGNGGDWDGSHVIGTGVAYSF